MDTLTQERDGRGRPIRRRTVAAGIGWSVPAVIVAQRAAAYSTSAPNITVIGGATKLPGNSCCAQWAGAGPCPYYKQSYRYYMTVFNPPGKDACLEVTKVLLGGTVTAGVYSGGAAAQDFQLFLPNNTVTTGCACGSVAKRSIFVPAGCSLQFAIDADSTSSANSNMYFEYSVFNAASKSSNVANSYVNNCANPTIATDPVCGTPDFVRTGQAVGTPVGGSCTPYYESTISSTTSAIVGGSITDTIAIVGGMPNSTNNTVTWQLYEMPAPKPAAGSSTLPAGAVQVATGTLTNVALDANGNNSNVTVTTTYAFVSGRVYFWVATLDSNGIYAGSTELYARPAAGTVAP